MVVSVEKLLSPTNQNKTKTKNNNNKKPFLANLGSACLRGSIQFKFHFITGSYLNGVFLKYSTRPASVDVRFAHF